MTPDINPIYAGLERSCPRDFKNVSYVDVGLVGLVLEKDPCLQEKNL